MCLYSAETDANATENLHCSSQVNGDGTPLSVLKADVMVAHAARFHFFILSKRLNIKLLFLVRHPLTNIRALQSWFVTPGHKSKTNNGSTTELARKWQ